jgi:D-alanine-D-alanine ligase
VKVALLHEALGPEARPDERDVLSQLRLVAAALEAEGHHALGVECAGRDLETCRRGLAGAAPDLVFNLVEGLAGSARWIHTVPLLLEEMGLRFTGASSHALYLTTHKLLAKQLMRGAGLPTPEAYRGAPARAGRFILKPVLEDASVGIDDRAVVEGPPQAVGEALERRIRDGAGACFAERYVEGRELNVSLLAKPGDVEVLPPAEICFLDFPADKPRIVGYAAKWSEESFESTHTPRSFVFPASDRRLLERLEELARACWSLFELAGWARVDFRVDPAGEPWILEVNANPCLSPDAGFLAAASRADLEPRQVISRIAEAALRPGG